uniref:Uncharacterized protein n=1 Tax=Arundo donax TaxID=35708 RepID=A0A0A9C204_ARUDO
MTPSLEPAKLLTSGELVTQGQIVMMTLTSANPVTDAPHHALQHVTRPRPPVELDSIFAWALLKGPAPPRLTCPSPPPLSSPVS